MRCRAALLAAALSLAAALYLGGGGAQLRAGAVALASCQLNSWHGISQAGNASSAQRWR
jgi:hypothetical protein